ncbi:hypothetical protein [Nocardiopsis halotolerans]|uniref:hypothetical protein n=1 Tax=Nocardiopsis halotolerans TaxID=124252 RepID=UPI0003792A96|nr:hypothetical protein [Nocardiopsis halotolerans]
MANRPVCSRQDRTTKVSAVVREGTTTTRVTGSSTIRAWDERSWLGGETTVGRARHTATSHSQSTLAAQLSFPARPEVPPRIALWAGVALLVLCAPYVFLLGVLGGVPAAITALVLRWWLGRDWRTTLVVSGAVLVLVGAVVHGVGSLFDGVDAFLSFPASLVAMATMAGAGVALVLWDARSTGEIRNRDEPLRAHAWRVWQRLYFCSRDDVVFDAASGAHCPPHAVRQLIGYPVRT